MIGTKENEMNMDATVVVLVNGEVLANGHGSRISDQRSNATSLAEGLLPLFASRLKLAVLHGNKPQVGFVLFRSELSSHVLHTVPLDVCGADTQGATGYMLSQAFQNTLRAHGISRRVLSVITETLVEADLSVAQPIKTIGPAFDREKAEQYRQTRGWTMLEEPGRGYRRAVPSFSPKEVLEMESIKQLVGSDDIVIAGGGGGIPVIQNGQGGYEGIEAVISTEQVAHIFARQLKASVMLMIIENDGKFLLSGMPTEGASHLDLAGLRAILERENFSSTSVQGKLQAAHDFLEGGGEQVVITTLRKLPDVFTRQTGLRLGSLSPSIDIFRVG
jgi:carbamate kinase